MEKRWEWILILLSKGLAFKGKAALEKLSLARAEAKTTEQTSGRRRKILEGSNSLRVKVRELGGQTCILVPALYDLEQVT